MAISEFIVPSLRIPAQAVREGYLRQGMKPEQYDPCACGLAAILGPDWSGGWCDDSRPDVPAAVGSYVSGFMAGFDGHDPTHHLGALRAGIIDGAAAWLAVKDLA